MNSFCAACEEPFSDVDKTSTKVRHSHHVIPRAFGGLNGPVVDVCNEDHDLLHRVAVQISSGKTVNLDNLKPRHKRAIEYLSSCVVNAQKAVENDPNKRTQISFVLTGEETRMLSVIQKQMGFNSREATIKHLITVAHKTKNPLSKP